MSSPLSPLEEILYKRLMASPGFHRFVRKVHARINRIPLEENEGLRNLSAENYQPTGLHKAKAFGAILFEELKKSFSLRSK